MNIFLEVLKTQWVYILLSVILVCSIFIVKAKFPHIYKTYSKVTLAITSILIVVLAIFFHEQDLFLLIPIFILCCELYDYMLCCKIASVLAGDYILIALINIMYEKNVINFVFNNIFFYALQVVTVIGIIFVVDKYMKELKEQQTSKKAEINDNSNLINNQEHSENNEEINDHIKTVLDDLNNYTLIDDDDKDTQ